MNNDVKIFGGMIAATLLLIVGAVFFLGRGDSGKSPESAAKPVVIAKKDLIQKDSWGVGSESAKVAIVEFGDFQCPACKTEEPVVEEVLKKYGDRIYFVFRHFPLTQVHPYALRSADAAEAAGKQGKFWEYHDKLFEISPDLTDENLEKAATEVGLDMEQFEKDLNSDGVRQQVLDDLADASKFGLTGTPTFFINGRMLRLASLPTFADFQKEIDKELN